MPSDWRPTEAHADYAAGHSLDLDHEAAMFRAHAETHDRRARSWNGAFSTWLGKASPRPNGSPVRRGGRPTAEEEAASMLASVARLEAARQGGSTQLFGPRAIGATRGAS